MHISRCSQEPVGDLDCNAANEGIGQCSGENTDTDGDTGLLCRSPSWERLDSRKHFYEEECCLKCLKGEH